MVSTNPADKALPVGTRLGGCAVAAVICVDADGIVYRMTESLLLGQIAIKEYFPQALAERVGSDVRPRPGADEAAFVAGAQAFAEEARQLSRWQHPGLLRVLDVFEAHGTVYRVMPLLEGRTLDAWRRENVATPDVAWLRELMLSLLTPVQALHDSGVLHGDIQPTKVLLTAGDRPVLLGSGAVQRALHPLPDSPYAPLEQTSVGVHLPRGAWTDLHAIAAVIWFAAVGRAPVPAAERRAGAIFVPALAMEAMLESSGGTARDRAQLVAAVDRAMALLPPDRPQNGAELRALFTAPAPAPASASGDIRIDPADALWHSVPPPPLPMEASPRRRTERRVAASVWVAVLLLGSAAGALAWRWNEVVQASRMIADVTRPSGAPDAAVRPGAPQPSTAEMHAAIEPPAPVPLEHSTADTPTPGEQAAPTAPVTAAASAVPPPTTTVAAAPPSASQPPAAPVEPEGLPPTAAGRVIAGPVSEAAVVPKAAEPNPEVLKEPEKRAAQEPPLRKAAAKPAPPPAKRPARPVTTAAAPAAAPATPRGACGSRQNFSLYYCMQTQCRKAEFSGHSQCRQLRETDEVG